MSNSYHPVQWNQNKYIYDSILLLVIIAYILAFMYITPLLADFDKPIDRLILRMRAFGSCAFLLLTFVLCIGPLARLDRRFLPLLYNRRHFGVMVFLVALAHAISVLNWYHAFSPIDPLVSLLSNNTNYLSLIGFPFEILGTLALLILFFMAATSHDYWLSFLTPPVWKALHMGVYIAYALVVMHIILGLLQTEQHPLYTLIVGLSLLLVIGLHLTAGIKEYRKEHNVAVHDTHNNPNLVIAASIDDIPNNQGIVVTLENEERVAIFRYNNQLSAISNVCAHQNGPLGEGCIVDGLVTCPWHGFQYNPADGCSLPPFTEKVSTYHLYKQESLILLDPNPLPPGTYVEPLTID